MQKDYLIWSFLMCNIFKIVFLARSFLESYFWNMFCQGWEIKLVVCDVVNMVISLEVLRSLSIVITIAIFTFYTVYYTRLAHEYNNCSQKCFFQTANQSLNWKLNLLVYSVKCQECNVVYKVQNSQYLLSPQKVRHL